MNDEPRTVDQNAKMWACLSDISRAIPWVVNGQTMKCSKEDWKEIFTAALSKEMRIAQGIDGGFVLLGRSSSALSKSRFADLVTLILAFGDERNVQWSDPKWVSMMREYSRAA